MNHSLKLNIDNSSIEERDFFEYVSDEPIADIAPKLEESISRTKTKLCAVLSSVSPADMSRISSAHCSKYLIVPDLHDKNLAPLKGKAIIREMNWIGTNIYLFDDESAIITYDDSGVMVDDHNAVARLVAHFRRWFWNECDFELIEDVSGVDNGVFDASRVATGFGIVTDCDDNVAILTEKCDAASLKGNYHKILDDKDLYFRTVPDLALLRERKNESFLTPEFGASFCQAAGDRYLLNYNPASYPTMPEKGGDRLLGIKTNDLRLGKKYRYCVKGRYVDLVGKKLKDSKGKDIVIAENASESKSLTLSLEEYQFFKELEKKDSQMLEDRLRSRNAELVSSKMRACQVSIDIAVDIAKHNSKSVKDPLYLEYSNMPKTLKQKKDELSKAFAEVKMDDEAEETSSISIPESFKESDSYNALIGHINALVDKFNQRGGETDDDLDEVLQSSKKKPKQIKTVSKLKESTAAPLPKFGTLYKNKDSYEYVLSDESLLDDARKETEERKWKNVSYFIE